MWKKRMSIIACLKRLIIKLNIKLKHEPEPQKKPGDKVNDLGRYNKIYEMLVKDNNDLTGQIAYCFYKKNKQVFIRQFIEKHGKRPSQQDIDNHVDFSEIPRINVYSELAENALKKVVIVAVKEKEEELIHNFKNDLWHFITHYEKEGFLERQYIKGKALLFGGVGGVLGNILTTVLLVLFLFFISPSDSKEAFFYNAKNNFISGLAEVIGVNIEIKSSKP